MAGIDDFFSEVEETEAVLQEETTNEQENEASKQEQEKDIKPAKEEKVKEDKENKKEESEKEEEKEKSPSILSLLASELGEDLPEDFLDKEEHTADDLIEYVKNTRSSHTESFLSNLETNFPDLYQVLEIAANGGDYKKAYQQLAPIKEVSDDESAKKVLVDYYKAKGLSDKVINTVLEDLELEEGLIEQANAINAEKLEEQKALAAREVEQAKAAQQKIEQENLAFIDKLKNKISSKNINGFTLQNSELKGVMQEVIQHTQRTADGRYTISLPMDSEDALNAALQAFIVYSKKGNLDQYLARKKTTLTLNQMMKSKQTSNSKATQKVNNLDQYFND